MKSLPILILTLLLAGCHDAAKDSKNQQAIQAVLDAGRQLTQRTGTIHGSAGVAAYANSLKQISAAECPKDFADAWAAWQAANSIYAQQDQQNSDKAALSAGLEVLGQAGLKQTPPNLEALYKARDTVREVALRYGAK